VLRPGGVLVATAISRFASLLDGLAGGALAEPAFRAMVERDLADGQHRNPDPEGRPEWFTTAYLHRPEELAAEVADAGLALDGLYGLEGVGWLVPALWDDGPGLARAVEAARAVETEPALLGASAHLLAAARR